jgi:phosphoribosylanthranilate isomerase
MRVRIKICGITNQIDADLAAALGADAIGFNAYVQSPRYLNPKEARAIVQRLPLFVEPIVIFVNESPVVAEQTVGTYGARTIQMHSDRHEYTPYSVTPGYRPWIPAFPVEDAASLRVITAFLEMQKKHGHLPAAILVDAHVPGMHGGTGQTAPWQLLADFKPGVPLILAGGLTPDNVAEAIRIVQPYAVDVASGVEASPGKKDPDKLRRFIDAVRAAC